MLTICLVILCHGHPTRDQHMHGNPYAMATLSPCGHPYAVARLGAVESHGRERGQTLAVLVLEDDVAETCAMVSHSKS